jgi:farnesyl-diphosphate farnesyltransferase
MIERLMYYSVNPSELTYLFQMKRKFKHFRPSEDRLTAIASGLSDEEFCFEALKKVSRSFSVVIQQLPEELRAPVCLFYLILRGLDTVEDDMQIEHDIKVDILAHFATRMNKEAFILENIGDTQDYRDLMLHFDKVLREYHKLDEKYRVVITDITERMAFGMNKYFIGEVVSYEDWDDYCHYVAGLVGIGLSELFIASGIEDDERLKDESLSNHMGLLLQKTNIIRDFAEDLDGDRLFWPKSAWSKHVDKPEKLQQDLKIGVTVLNELVVNALTHVPHCLHYMSALKNHDVFRFCAIPQLMAIATLFELYDNQNVLIKNVKIRKGKTARYFMSDMDYDATKAEFKNFLQKLYNINGSSEIKELMDKIDQQHEVGV